MQPVLYYDQSQLCFSDVQLTSLLQSGKVQGPTYVYSSAVLKKRISLYQSVIQSSVQKPQIHYALKANSHPEILKMMKDAGFGVDVVSFGEMKKALQNGFAAGQVIFSGVGKTIAEIEQAMTAGVGQINVESVSEIKRCVQIATRLNKKVDIAIRVNPAVDPQTHPYISTGFRENKFGIDEADLYEVYSILKKQDVLRLKALSMHIGSQLVALSSFEDALVKLKRMLSEANDQGFQIEKCDVGGGVGIFYQDDAAKDSEVLNEYGKILKKHLGDYKGVVEFEPGRFLVARAGLLLTQIQYIKKTPFKTFVIVDSGMHHLMRPALYNAYHRVFPLQERSGKMIVDVVGPVCESSDFFAKIREITTVEEGDWLAVADSGAYGYSMVSLYNDFAVPNQIFL